MTREEAIEVYNGLINTKIKEAFEFFAPELRESEDERIRKALVIMMKVPRKGIFEAQGITKEQALAYLEKPKEPIDPFDTKLFQDGVKEGRRLEREDIKKEQKPAEWSEEDENNLELVIDCIYKFYPNPVMKYKLKEWLKSLRPVKQEWRDEDEKMRRNLMSLLANMRGDRITEETYQKYYPWLKSLRPSWKPSEEQPQVADASKMEQPEVDLITEYDERFDSDPVYRKLVNRSAGIAIARHFYELGLKAREEE